MRIGFASTDITPPVGMELAGYAGYRPCSGVHDPLWCKAVVLEQGETRYALVALDLMCVDEPLYRRIGEAVSSLGIRRDRLIVSAIHSHAAPQGVIPGEGVLATINAPCHPENPEIGAYLQSVIGAATQACRQAVAQLEPFQVRTARGPVPAVGSERHTGDAPRGELTVIQCRCENGRLLTMYNFPCHPTVTNAENLLVSADFVAEVEGWLEGDMAVFLNGAAGDISTRFTRRESSFDECSRMGKLAAEAILSLIGPAPFRNPEPIRGIHATVTLRVRQTEPVETARKNLERATVRWQAAQDRGELPDRLRILKSHVEGAWVNLEFARGLGDIRQLQLPVTVFRLWNLDCFTVPGELFSSLKPEGTVAICYANGYFRYLCPAEAYEAGYYEALAAIVAPGEAEVLMARIVEMLEELEDVNSAGIENNYYI